MQRKVTRLHVEAKHFQLPKERTRESIVGTSDKALKTLKLSTQSKLRRRVNLTNMTDDWETEGVIHQDVLAKGESELVEVGAASPESSNWSLPGTRGGVQPNHDPKIFAVRINPKRPDPQAVLAKFETNPAEIKATRNHNLGFGWVNYKTRAWSTFHQSADDLRQLLENVRAEHG